MIGRLLDALDQSPARENTIVCLWSDHGYHLGEKWHWHKQALWHRATHVPLIVSAPGVGRGSTRCSRPASLLDVYPTLTELAGIPAPAGLDGESLRPFLETPQAPSNRTALSTFLHRNHSVIGERYHYIRYASGEEELYDRQQDPNEWLNLASRSDYAAIKRQLARSLPATDAPNAPRAGEYHFDPATVKWSLKKG
jgi:arylsulfatase A-like enzyme